MANEVKEYWEIESLSNWEKNPRSISTKEFGHLKNLIKKLGEIKPIIVSKDSGFVPDGTIAGGNMRYRAMRELGYKQCWVTTRKFENEKEMVEVALADNERAGVYDEDALAELVYQFKDEINMDDFTVDLKEPAALKDVLDNYGPSNEKEDEVPEVKQTDIKRGDMFQLGKHILLCGDSTNKVDVERLMGNDKADMVFTDPPYGVDYEGKTKEKLKIQNDITTDAFKNSIPCLLGALKAGGSLYICCPAGDNFLDFAIPFSENFHQSSTIIWNKNSMVMGHGDYHYKHEPILYGWEKNGSHKFYGDRTQTTVWDIDRPSRSTEHPTMKPIELCARAIKNSSKGEAIVLDIFGGSGSTLIAAEKLNRKCRMMEFDPIYVQTIIDRWEKITEKKATKL